MKLQTLVCNSTSCGPNFTLQYNGYFAAKEGEGEGGGGLVLIGDAAGDAAAYNLHSQNCCIRI